MIKRVSVVSVVLSPQHNQNYSRSSISFFFLLQNSSIQIHSKAGSPTHWTRRNNTHVPLVFTNLAGLKKSVITKSEFSAEFSAKSTGFNGNWPISKLGTPPVPSILKKKSTVSVSFF
jgi:hypothetical protein